MEKQNKKNISAPHDRYFKMAMSDNRVAKEFFETHLPNDLLPLVDLTFLTPQPGSYIDEMRQEAIADMLFKTKVKNEDAFLYLVVDHQSQPDKLMPFRVLKYVTNIIDQHLKATKVKTIPLVIPMVVYHGKKPWNYSTDIKDLVDAPKPLVNEFFLKPFKLIDLNVIDDEILKQKIWSGAMALTLKRAFAPNIMPYLHDIMHLLREIEQLNGTTFAQDTLVYILTTTQIGNKEIFVGIVKNEMSPQTGEKIMTIAEQFRYEGKQEGIEEVATRLMATGAGLNFVSEVTKLSIEELESLMVVA